MCWWPQWLVVFRCLRSVLVTSMTGYLRVYKICVGDLNDWLSSGIIEFWQEQDASREVTELEGDGRPCVICWSPRCWSERSTPQGRKWHHTGRCKYHWVGTSESLVVVVSVAVCCMCTQTLFIQSWCYLTCPPHADIIPDCCLNNIWHQ